MKAIWLDMDGTFVSLYEVEGWLDDLINHRTRPYREAKPLINMSVFARMLNKLVRNGYTVNIVSWLSKDSNAEYDAAVEAVKRAWLAKHLPSVTFNRIEILPYGTPKSTVGTGILFDDEERNRTEWKGIAYSNTELLGKLKELAQ